jgi:hypothetical protein
MLVSSPQLETAELLLVVYILSISSFLVLPSFLFLFLVDVLYCKACNYKKMAIPMPFSWCMYACTYLNRYRHGELPVCRLSDQDYQNEIEKLEFGKIWRCFRDLGLSSDKCIFVNNIHWR